MLAKKASIVTGICSVLGGESRREQGVTSSFKIVFDFSFKLTKILSGTPDVLG